MEGLSHLRLCLPRRGRARRCHSCPPYDRVPRSQRSISLDDRGPRPSSRQHMGFQSAKLCLYPSFQTQATLVGRPGRCLIIRGQRRGTGSSSPNAEHALTNERNQITLMDWGNAIVRSKDVDSSGTITALVMELHLEGDFKKTTKKITWLAHPTTADR